MVNWIAYILIVVGVGLRFMAIHTLRTNFSLMLRQPETIVTQGVYRWLRHPSYVGSLLILAGIYLLSPMLAFLWLAFAFFLARAVQEESMLSVYPAYREYMKRVGGFVPRFWR